MLSSAARRHTWDEWTANANPCQSSWVASLTTSLCQMWAGKCNIMLPLWQQEEWSSYKHQSHWAEQESPLYLGEEVNQGQGQGQDKDPTQETKLSLFHLTNWQPRPQSSLRQSSQPGYHPKQMLHALLASLIMSIKHPQNTGLLCYTTSWWPRQGKEGSNCTPNEPTSFMVLTISQLNVKRILPKIMTLVLE